MNDILRGITRSGAHAVTNPDGHSPLCLQNRIHAQLWGPDDSGQVVMKQEVDHVGNIMCTYGLNRLIEMLASDTDGATGWVSAMAIGTDTTAANSTNNALGNSTGIIHLSQASMAASDAGALTLQYNGTFASDNPAGAAAIHEVGLFATNAATAAGVARSVLGTDSINKGASDSIYISYQVIASTA